MPRDQLLRAQLLRDPTLGLRRAILMRLVRHQTTDGCPLAAPPIQRRTGGCSGHRRLALHLCQATLSRRAALRHLFSHQATEVRALVGPPTRGTTGRCSGHRRLTLLYQATLSRRAVLSRRAILRRLVSHQAADLCALIAPSIRGIGESSRRRRPTRRPGVIRGFRSLEASPQPKSRPSLGTQPRQSRRLPLLAVLRRREPHLLALGASLAQSILVHPVDSRYPRPVGTQLR